MKAKKAILICLLSLIPFFGFSQINVTTYSLYALGVGIPVSNNVGLELKTFANAGYIENVGLEFAGFYNFKPSDYHRFSLGAGVGFKMFEGEGTRFTIPAILEVYPLQSFKRLSFLFELAPEIYFEGDANLRHLWGIRYTFSKK